MEGRPDSQPRATMVVAGQQAAWTNLVRATRPAMEALTIGPSLPVYLGKRCAKRCGKQ
jgi:hypothetical protein